MEALKGVKILDMTHVQSGPTCTQLLAWFGADVVKVERPGVGDATRGQLRDVPKADSLYFTMLNSNKRSITLNPKNPDGAKIFTSLIEQCDVMVENFAPGALDRMGFSWEKIQEINPRIEAPGQVLGHCCGRIVKPAGQFTPFSGLWPLMWPRLEHPPRRSIRPRRDV